MPATGSIGFRAITNQYTPSNGENFIFPDPMAVVFWSKNRVLYIAPQKRKQDVLIPNMVLILAYGLCIKSYEQLKQQKWYYKIITGNYYKIVIIYVFPNAGNQLSYAIQEPYFCLRGPAKAPTPASAEGASLNLINFNYPPHSLKYDTSQNI